MARIVWDGKQGTKEMAELLDDFFQDAIRPEAEQRARQIALNHLLYGDQSDPHSRSLNAVEEQE